MSKSSRRMVNGQVVEMPFADDLVPVSRPYVEQTGEPGEAATMDEALSVPCVWCDADAGEPCKRLATDEIRDVPHASRLRTVPIVEALVAAAEERGRVEGAAKERGSLATSRRINDAHAKGWQAGYALGREHGHEDQAADLELSDAEVYRREMADIPDAARPDLGLDPGTRADGYSS